MRSKWLHRKENGKLMLFCNGWGMDEYPLLPLQSHEWNVLMFYDYVDLVPDHNLRELFKSYEETVLVAWSMGVWAGQQLFSPFQKDLKAALAVNGTLCPIDDQFGIPVNVVQATLAGFDKKQRTKFYHRMCRDRTLYRTFLDYQPARGVDNQKTELAHLLKTVACDEQTEPIYTYALVADHDYIIPTANQLNFWPEKIVRRVSGYHFLFYAYQSWDEIVLEAERKMNGSES